MSETQKHTKPNVPNLRFPGFEGEWERKKIGSICSFFSGGTPSSSQKEYYGGVIPFIRSGEIHSDKTELFLTEKGYDNSSAKMVEKGDILLALYGANSGDISISQIQGAINQAILCIRTDVTPSFFISVWEKHVQRVLNTYLQGGQGNLSAEIVKSIPLFIPSPREQEKLAGLFSLLDERIAVQSKVIECYKSLIRAIYEGFSISTNGIECAIGDILSIGSGKDYKHLPEGNIPVYGTGGYMLSVDDWLYDGESVCIGRKGTIDHPFYIKGKFWTVDTLFYTYDFRGVIPKYCYYLFRTINWQQYKEASGVPSLSKKTIEKIKVRIPSIDTQLKAVAVLDAVENSMTVGKQTIHSYQKMKEYLLSQLII